MAVSKQELEKMMDEMGLKFFHRQCDDGELWMMAFNGFNLMFLLQEQGEFLLIFTTGLLDLTQISQERRRDVCLKLMEWNVSRKLGHYSADEIVTFSMGVSIEDGQLAVNQLRRCIASVFFEAESHFPEIPRLAGLEIAPEEVCVGSLFEQLMERGTSDPGAMN